MSTVIDNPNPLSYDKIPEADERARAGARRRSQLNAAVSSDIADSVSGDPVLGSLYERFVRRRRRAAIYIPVSLLVIAGGLAILFASMVINTGRGFIPMEEFLPPVVAAFVLALAAAPFLAQGLVNRHPAINHEKPEVQAEVAQHLRGHGVELSAFGLGDVQASLIGGWRGGDGKTVRTDRLHESLPRAQKLLDDWAAEDAVS